MIKRLINGRWMAAGAILCGSSLLTLAAGGPASRLIIENKLLAVRFDDASSTFSVTEKASGLTFVRNGTLWGTGMKAQVESVKDPVFGAGKCIRLNRFERGVETIELYSDLPFVLIRGELHNHDPGTKDVTSLVPAAFTLDLGKASDALRTQGTAGLTAPDQNPGSYLFLTLADPATRRGVVAGWLTSDRGSGVLFSSVGQGMVRFEARLDYGHLRLRPGESAKLETLAIGIFNDARLGQESFGEALARQYHIHLRPPLAGYCTWYSDQHGGGADENSIVALAEFAAKELEPFGFSFVQIDDQWQDGRERNGPARGFLRARPGGPYPHGMKPVADRIQALGLTAGLWFLPFASDYLDPEFKDRQAWFAKRPDGSPFETPWGNTSLDLTRPEVQSYLAEMVRTIHGWGFHYFKMDGLWTGAVSEQVYVNDGYRDDHFGANAPFHDPKKTNLEVFRDGLRRLREAVGPEVFFSGCNVSQNMRTLGACVGLVDSMRIGPDNGQRWRDYRDEIAKNESGSIITGPVRGTRLYFLNGRTWWNDPDPTYVRATVPIEQARMITSWVALSGQFYLNSDWLPALPVDRLDIIKRTIPPHRASARPVDYFDTPMPRIWLVTDSKQTVRRDVLGLFNWESTSQSIASTAAKAGLDPAGGYFAFDFWRGVPAESFSGQFSYEVPAQSCRIIALRAAEGHPVLVSTSRHVTQGIIDVSGEKWSIGSKTLSGTSELVGNDPYELRIAGLIHPEKSWKLASAAVSAADKKAGVAVESLASDPGEPGWLRVRIRSQETRAVDWSIEFL